MTEMYTVRNVSDRTRKQIDDYAKEYNLTVAQALQQLIEFGLEYVEQHKKNPKKYLNLGGAIASMPKW